MSKDNSIFIETRVEKLRIVHVIFLKDKANIEGY